MATQPHYVTETQILQRIVRNPECRFIWTRHALEQIAKRNINAADVVQSLTNGHVVLAESKQDVLWRTEGHDIDGNRLEVVVAVYEASIEIKVVTAF
jgi:hypothetical protein